MELTEIKGVGPKKKDLLRKLDICTVSDLYNYYPVGFEDRRRKATVDKASPDIKYYFCWKIISRPSQARTRRGVITHLRAYEEASGEDIKLIWFNDRFSASKLEVNQTYKFYTKLKVENGNYSAVNPMFVEMDDELIGSIIPIYPLTAGLTHKQISAFIKESLKFYDKNEEIFDDNLRAELKLASRLDNLTEIHKPTEIESLQKAKSELKVTDFVKELVYTHTINKQNEVIEDLKLSYDLEEILGRLSFTLTRSQLISLKEILADLSSPKPMNRLLIGDVGSGKTIVAIIAMIIFGLNGYQAAMMVPTEVLASQQFEKNKDFIESFGLKVGLLTGSVKEKDKLKEKLIKGEVDLVIGTHALIQEDVNFKNLKLVINDEQHRFGVGQRRMLGEKGEAINYLTMTATPIPRTISLRLSKILDLSMITDLPAGRKPIVTKLIHESMEAILYQELRANIEAGRQAYVVSNNIDADDKNSVENLYKRYKEEFKTYKIKKLHGDMKAADKDKTLKDFAAGKIDILISTTVIEVGIDVANANVMVVYNASNFGLSSLHQLRGRVGRGAYESYCFLVSKNVDSHSKLNILVNNENGFDIAKKDYNLRGGGKILSSIQHGRNLSQVEYLNMTADEIDRSFEIFDILKKNDFEGVNMAYLEKFFTIDKRIILN